MTNPETGTRELRFAAGASACDADTTVLVRSPLELRAAVGPRNVTVTNPDLSQATLTGGFTVASDHAPSVSISQPADQQDLLGIVTFSASAWDDRGVVAVEFRVDGVSVGRDATFPYQVLWSTAGATQGSHQLQVTAEDTVGQTSSAEVQFTVVPPPGRPPRRRVLFPVFGD